MVRAASVCSWFDMDAIIDVLKRPCIPKEKSIYILFLIEDGIEGVMEDRHRVGVA